MKIFDLTHDLVHGLGVFPGDPECTITSAQEYQNGYFVSKIGMGTHTGTHVDAPVHKIPGAKSLTDLSVHDFMAEKCVVLDCREIEGEIDAAFLRAHADELQGCDGVIFRSGWTEKWATDAFFNAFPGINEDAAEALKQLGIRIIGVETPSVNPARHDTVHTALLGAEIVIVEALCGLEQLEGSFEFYAAPLKLKDRDGSPVRAFAVQRG